MESQLSEENFTINDENLLVGVVIVCYAPQNVLNEGVITQVHKLEGCSN